MKKVRRSRSFLNLAEVSTFGGNVVLLGAGKEMMGEKAHRGVRGSGWSEMLEARHLSLCVFVGYNGEGGDPGEEVCVGQS